MNGARILNTLRFRIIESCSDDSDFEWNSKTQQPIHSKTDQIEGFFLGIFQDLITKVLFEKSSELMLGF